MRILFNLAVACLMVSCGRSSQHPHVILISLDTLRADHLGCYGYGRPTSPHLDSLAVSAVRFETALTPAPWTLPAHAAMLTGVHPHLMGFNGADAALPDTVPTLAEELQRVGFDTAAFVDSGPKGYVGARRGFDRGFRVYEHGPHAEGRRHDLGATVDALAAWLPERAADRPLFLFVHSKGTHALPIAEPCTDEHCYPYDKGEPFRSRFLRPPASLRRWEEPSLGHGQAYLWSLNHAFQAGRRQTSEFTRQDKATLIDLYDAGIAATDASLGRLFDLLDRHGLLDRALVIVTSDHGEAFLERHTFMHQEVYEPLLRVPLLVRWPGQEVGRVEALPVGLEDIAPTVLAAMAGHGGVTGGHGGPPLRTGLPLAREQGGGKVRSDRPFFAYYAFDPPFTYRAAALRRDDFKLVLHNFQRNGEPEIAELYNLTTDPGEERPLPATDAPGPELRRLLDALRSRPPMIEGRRIRGAGEVRGLGYID